MKDRKCAPDTNRQATSETDTWLVSFMENLRRIEHWVLVTAADCPSAIHAGRLKLREQLMNPLGDLDFRKCVRTTHDGVASNPFRPSSYLALDERFGNPRPVHLSTEAVEGFLLSDDMPANMPLPSHAQFAPRRSFDQASTDEHDSVRSMPTVH